MASIYTSRGRLYISHYLNGRRIKKALGLDDTPKNRAKAQELLPEIVKVLMGAKAETPKHTLNYYINLFLRGKEREKAKLATMKQYRAISKQLAFELGGMEIGSVKVSDLKGWIGKVMETKSPKTVRNYVTVVKGIFQEAIFDEVIEKNPADFIKLPKLVKSDVDPFSTQEVQLLIESSDGWFRNLIALLAYTGMRTGEAIGLQWSDVDWDNAEIYIQRTRDNSANNEPKTAQSKRRVPIFSALMPFLRSQYAVTGLKPSGYVFVVESTGKAWASTSNITAWHWLPLLRSLNLKERRLYELRHTFAINMLDSGEFAVSQISKWMGHTTTQMLFTVYARYIKSEKREINTNFNLYKISPQNSPQKADYQQIQS